MEPRDRDDKPSDDELTRLNESYQSAIEVRGTVGYHESVNTAIDYMTNPDLIKNKDLPPGEKAHDDAMNDLYDKVMDDVIRDMRVFNYFLLSGTKWEQSETQAVKGLAWDKDDIIEKLEVIVKRYYDGLGDYTDPTKPKPWLTKAGNYNDDLLKEMIVSSNYIGVLMLRIEEFIAIMQGKEVAIMQGKEVDATLVRGAPNTPNTARTESGGSSGSDEAPDMIPCKKQRITASLPGKEKSYNCELTKTGINLYDKNGKHRPISSIPDVRHGHIVIKVGDDVLEIQNKHTNVQDKFTFRSSAIRDDLYEALRSISAFGSGLIAQQVKNLATQGKPEGLAGGGKRKSKKRKSKKTKKSKKRKSKKRKSKKRKSKRR
jgi:hypothetical protein